MSALIIKQLQNKYANEKPIIHIINFLTENKNFKSLIELNLNEYEVNDIEKILFNFREPPYMASLSDKAFVGLVFYFM